MFVLNTMVNEFTWNHIVRSDSIMIVSIFCKHLIQLKFDGICYTAFIGSDYFLRVKKTTK